MLHGTITRAGAVAPTGSDGALRRELRAGRWRREHQGVYAEVRRDFDHRARLAAALLRAGPGAHLSHDTAAAMHDVAPAAADSLIHITVPRHRRPRPIAGVVLHRSTSLPQSDRAVVDGLAVTGVERTVLDVCGTVLVRRDRVAFVAQVVQLGRTSHARLRACLERSRGLHGCGMLGDALEDLAPGFESIIESDLATWCARAGLRVQAQITVHLSDGSSHRLDLLDEDLLIDAEADGAEHHLSVLAREDDERRDRALRGAGLEVVRFTGRQIRRERGAVIRQLSEVRVRRAAMRPRPQLAAGVILVPPSRDNERS